MAQGERLGRLAARKAGKLGAAVGRDAAQDGIHKGTRAPAVSLAELDRIEHRGMGRHAVEVEELERAEAQRFADLGPQPRRDASENAAMTRSSELRRLIVPITSS